MSSLNLKLRDGSDADKLLLFFNLLCRWALLASFSFDKSLVESSCWVITDTIEFAVIVLVVADGGGGIGGGNAADLSSLLKRKAGDAFVIPYECSVVFLARPIEFLRVNEFDLWKNELRLTIFVESLDAAEFADEGVDAS